MCTDNPVIERMERYGYIKDSYSPKPEIYCEGCGEGVYEGEAYYEIGGTVLCEHCINDMQKLA